MNRKLDLKTLAGDLAAIGAFALFARIAHRSETMPLNFLGWLSTLWPFALGVFLGWGIVALTGKDAHAVRGGGIVIWLVTVVVGLTVWGMKHGQVPHWSFMIVAGSMSALLMLGWRGVATAVKSRK
ncbi:membrane protein [Corynebacterium atypicum]|uniref:Membrane protein n=1 Tax=Corynebacterium atypicum TaxID=191610 RepID=A0ABM5QPJ6_9CORY|nr:DUF3054 domain-containing protein [Corynebacterium atypicum]AIG64810.1 membrane protein [Corynebacterium atypicum]